MIPQKQLDHNSDNNESELRSNYLKILQMYLIVLTNMVKFSLAHFCHINTKVYSHSIVAGGFEEMS